MCENTAVPLIDTTGISDEQKSTAQFQSAYREMLAQLSSPGFAAVLCAHEAAHLFYFALVGSVEYEAAPAKIYYDPQIRDYAGNMASVQLLKPPVAPQPEKLAEWFCLIACAHAAGGVVARKLYPSTGGGDSDDKERFQRICVMLNQDYDKMWMWAQDAVSEKPEMTNFIAQQGAILKRELGLEAL